jgi:TonB family protein
MRDYVAQFLILIALSISLGPSVRAERTNATPVGQHELSDRDKLALAIKTPFPDYPFEARVRHITGSGVAVLEVDRQTGGVTSAQMAVSTGYQILDNSALAAFRCWRFKPGTVTKVKIPITFVMSYGGYFAGPVHRTVPLPTDHPVKVHPLGRGADAIALYTPAPDYPLAARSHHISGSGIAVVTIDAKSGTVVNARMNPSTGHLELDGAALGAFKRWRFKPGVGGEFKIPVTYKL